VLSGYVILVSLLDYCQFATFTKTSLQLEQFT
jgi:hypothetical protein